LLGEGSAGKSTILTMTKDSITDIYFNELKSDVFSTNSSEKNKLMNTYLDNKQILITWINEFSSERIDTSMFKSFAEGSCATTKLYTEGSFRFSHKSKIIATSNEMPNIKIDTGTSRRIIAYTHKSKFVDDVDDVDESKNIYLKNKNLLSEWKTSGLLDTWIDILADKAHKYMNGMSLKYSKNFIDTKDLVISSNDYIQDFIDNKIIKKPNASIGKKQMHTAFSKMYPNRHLKELDIIIAFKSKGIVYDKDKRIDGGIRGCFLDVGFKNDDDDDDNEEIVTSAVNLHEPIMNEKMKQKIMKEVNELRRQLKEKDERIRELESMLPSHATAVKKITTKNEIPTKNIMTVKKITTKNKMADDISSIILG